MKTLYEQIIEIHSRHFNKEFHEYRQNLVPAMLNDLAMKFFDDLTESKLTDTWFAENTVDIRAVKRARLLVSTVALRENEPAVE